MQFWLKPDEAQVEVYRGREDRPAELRYLEEIYYEVNPMRNDFSQDNVINECVSKSQKFRQLYLNARGNHIQEQNLQLIASQITHNLKIAGKKPNDLGIRYVEGIADHIIRGKKGIQSLIQKLSGKPCPSGIRNVLAKLPDDRIHWRNYVYILELLRADNARSILLNKLEKIHPHDIFILINLSDESRSVEILNAVRNQEDLDDLESMKSYVKVLCKRTQSEVDYLYSRIGRNKTISEHSWDIIRKHVYFLPLPHLFIEDHKGKVEPVYELPELKNLSSTYKNCLWRTDYYISGIFKGIFEVYEWTGKERAIVLLERVGQQSWAISEVKGIDNNNVCGGTRKAINQHFQAFGVYSNLPPLFRDNYLGL